MMLSKIQQTYVWTHHAHDKMRYYRLTEARIKRIIRHPARIEEGIVEGAIACMQSAIASAKGGSAFGGKAMAGKGRKNYSEIWVMYAVKQKQIIIITAWRYPGKSPERDPVPQKVLGEVRNIIAGIRNG
jgi:hypothetical protein